MCTFYSISKYWRALFLPCCYISVLKGKAKAMSICLLLLGIAKNPLLLSVGRSSDGCFSWGLHRLWTRDPSVSRRQAPSTSRRHGHVVLPVWKVPDLQGVPSGTKQIIAIVNPCFCNQTSLAFNPPNGVQMSQKSSWIPQLCVSKAVWQSASIKTPHIYMTRAKQKSTSL